MDFYAGIVGFGVAGATLAIRFLEAGIPVVIFTNQKDSDSSRVAAGLLNPYAPKRLMPGWRGLEFATEAHAFYSSIQTQTGIPFYINQPIYKIFPNQHYKTDWKKRQKQHPESISEPFTSVDAPYIHAPLDGAQINGTGVADGKGFMDAAEKLCKPFHHFKNEVFIHENLVSTQDRFEYGELRFKHIIYAEGLQYVNNPLLQHLDLNPLKGDVLRIKIKDFDPSYIYQTQQFLAKTDEEGVFKFGSTYLLEFDSAEPQIEELAFLDAKLKEMLNCEYEIISHNAGLRPCSFDRKPYVGRIKEGLNAYVYNGLGSKGYLMAPTLSKELLEHIMHGKELDIEMNPNKLRKVKGFPKQEHQPD